MRSLKATSVKVIKSGPQFRPHSLPLLKLWDVWKVYPVLVNVTGCKQTVIYMNYFPYVYLGKDTFLLLGNWETCFFFLLFLPVIHLKE